MICEHAKQTGKTCKGGFSREIDCRYSKTNCLRDCDVRCPGFESPTLTAADVEQLRRIERATTPGGCCGG